MANVTNLLITLPKKHSYIDFCSLPEICGDRFDIQWRPWFGFCSILVARAKDEGNVRIQEFVL